MKIELKTLKDLGISKYMMKFTDEADKLSNEKRMDFTAGTFNLHSEAELKAEAVKWVKFYQKKKFINDESAQWLRMWIIKFFNLTEKDLK